VNLFRGQSSDLGGKSVFGGQVVGQALAAATRTVEGRLPHSLHAYFLLPGDMAAPIVYEVERIRDGKSFSARRVQAIQHGQPILSMIASFQVEEEGFEHQVPPPQVPPPEGLKNFAELRDQWLSEVPGVPARLRESLTRPTAIEIRPIDPWNPLKPTPREPKQAVWFRTVDRLEGDAILHHCLLAYASDFALIGTALQPHGLSWFAGGLVLASLDHAMWFHHPIHFDDWLLYAQDSPSASGARGFNRGAIFSRDGTLIASVIQEGLIRPRA
jgi:acyl-CoA thioesterase-2